MTSLMTVMPVVMVTGRNKTAAHNRGILYEDDISGKHKKQPIWVFPTINMTLCVFSSVSTCACGTVGVSPFSLHRDAIKVKTQIRPTGVLLPPKIPSQEKAVKRYVFSGSTLNGRTSTRHEARAPLGPSACDLPAGTWTPVTFVTSCLITDTEQLKLAVGFLWASHFNI